MPQSVTSRRPNVVAPSSATAPAPAIVAPRKRKSRRRRYVLIGIGALLLVWIIGAIIWSKREKPIPVTTEKAAKRTIVQLVSATGKAQPETEVKISPEVAGEIIDVPVIEGGAGKEGDLHGQVGPGVDKALLGAREARISSGQAT